ncbi:DUF2812 domain-containing protein [Virgibacillus sp. NKC19-16]|uniref:DUF2812 domain-containing protein n=1 Tax=Virgibacillus salidurans TaxID=2831673 RepID=UPI001F26567B|nr:DUF2812 domain-containing protein [Virgibacillus sp. NKC19-16]UJL46381.1 DUF2812 domain-containing protein [Virgibacillus sp. NKC19-16]
MKDIKYITNGGLAFSEEKEMKKLQEYAREGWIFEGFVLFGFYFKLRKGESQNIVYSLDYRDDADEEYFAFFEAAGWSAVYSNAGMHIFTAAPGTKPIYTDNDTIAETYEKEKNRMAKGFMGSLIISVILITLLALANNVIVTVFIAFLFSLSIASLVFTWMPYRAYKSKLKKLGSMKRYDAEQ